MTNTLHQIRKCLRPNCGFRFPNHLDSDQYIYCPKCGSPTEIVDMPYDSMVVDPDSSLREAKFEVLLDNIRSAYNVGSIMRTADGIGITHLHFCGFTPPPDHPKVKKTALDAQNFIPWTQYWDSLEAVRRLKNEGYLILALEGGDGAVPLFQIFKEIIDKPLVLVVGNEISGVDPGLLALCDHKIWLPMSGKKQSFNVSVAFGIAAYLIKYASFL